jgi:hypothetical protein
MKPYALSIPIGLFIGELLYRRVSTFETTHAGRGDYWGFMSIIACSVIHWTIIISMLITEQKPFFWR